MFDLKLQGEASTSPHTRIPPWQSETAKANVQTSLQVASGPESGGSLKLGPGHLHLWQMAFKSLHTQVKNLNPATRPPKSSRMFKRDQFSTQRTLSSRGERRFNQGSSNVSTPCCSQTLNLKLGCTYQRLNGKNLQEPTWATALPSYTWKVGTRHGGSLLT